jgi:hypothetical protein
LVAAVCSSSEALPFSTTPPTAVPLIGPPSTLGKVPSREALMTSSCCAGAIGAPSTISNPVLSKINSWLKAGSPITWASAGIAFSRARAIWMSAFRASAPASSRDAADNSADVPTPPVRRFELYCNDVNGVTTANAPSTVASSSVMRSSSARLAPSYSSLTSEPSVDVKSRITVSPPKSSWKATLSIAICESEFR